jgi:hypothetical protein
VALEGRDDASVAGDLGVPATAGGVVVERLDVGELLLEDGQELDGGDEVVALLADVGIQAGLGDQVAGLGCGQAQLLSLSPSIQNQRPSVEMSRRGGRGGR